MPNRYQVFRRARQAPAEAASAVTAPLIAGIVGGLAWAAGAEAWAWLSPMRRKQERAMSEDPASEIYEGEFYEVDTDDYEDEGE